MRAPPAVSVSCTPGRAWRAFQASVGASAGAALGAWCGLTFAHSGAVVATAIIGASLLAALTWRLSAQPVMRLAWTGSEWHLSGEAGAGDEGQTVPAPTVMIDLGGWMLLRTRPTGRAGACWLTLSRRTAGPAWHLFRAAVYSFETSPSAWPSGQSPHP